MLEEITSEKLNKQLEAIRSASLHSADDIAFENAASVLVFFDPNILKPLVFENIEPSFKWKSFLKYSEPVFDELSGNSWQLKYTFRRQALTRLANEKKIHKAIEANLDRSKNFSQNAFYKVLKQESVNLSNLNREELVVYLNLLEWVDGILPISISIKDIHQILKKRDLFSPMHRLIDHGFVGRQMELIKLSKYIGINNSASLVTKSSRFFVRLLSSLQNNPPYLITGPGGVGKSSLVAKLILEHAEVSLAEPLPFAYLNIDSAFLDVERPETFIMEAAKQLSIQITEKEQDLLNLYQKILYDSGHLESLEYSKSYFGFEQYVEVFGRIINDINKPVLLVVDTFEEVQYLGKEVTHIIWDLLSALQQAAPNVRTIVAGRVMIYDFPVIELRLSDLSPKEASQLLRDNFSKAIEDKRFLKKVIQDIIRTVGLNPLSLRLATKIVRDQGIENLKSIETKEWLVLKVRSEVIQSRLYGRILSHVHDEEVRKLVFPGLIVRRINPEIILKVLGIPCGLKITSQMEAEELFEKLRKEISLVEENHLDHSVHHRQDIRRTMLPDLKNEISIDNIKSIHDAAILYYSTFEDIISRAEEIYHRLCRGDQPQDLETLWQDGVRRYLHNVLFELDGKAKLWLSRKLNVTPDQNILKNANIQEWEEITKKAVERYLKNGYADDALAVLSTRKERSLGSPLYRLEMEALRILGKYEDVCRLADNAIHEALEVSDTTPSIRNLYELSLQAALSKEALGELEGGLRYINQAKDLFGTTQDNITRLRILITNIRLLRKLGETKDNERANVIEEVKDILSQKTILDQMQNYPALFREVVAELGKLLPDILQKALDWFGIEITNEQQAETLTNALINLNDKTLSFQEGTLGKLVDNSGIERNNTSSWLNYIHENSGKKLNENLKQWRNEISARIDQNMNSIQNFDKAVTEVYRNNVDNSLNPNKF